MYDELIKRLKNCATQAAPCLTCDMTDDGSCIETLMKQAADAIEELQQAVLRLEEASGILDELPMYQQPVGWIPVTERLPEEMDRSCGGWSAEIRPSYDVLVWLSPEKRQSVAWYSHTYNEWTTVDENTVYCFDEITHWQSLSEPPKEE